MYNTGDIGRLWDDGQLDHLGRIDDQVKIKVGPLSALQRLCTLTLRCRTVQGFRVELDGVSAAIRACPDVTTACALLVEQDLWAFYAPEHISASQVRTAMMNVLPYYAVPSRYHALSSIPLTS